MTRLSILLPIALFLIQTGCASFGGKRPEGKVKEAAASLQKIFQQQSDQNPFDLNLLKHPIVFVSVEKEKAWLFHHSKISRTNFADWKPYLKNTKGHFEVASIGSAPHLLLLLDSSPSAQQLVTSALHEGFHVFHQLEANGWSNSPESQTRGTIYPLQIHPRYFRWEMYQNLKNYLETEKTKYLQLYSGWLHRWVDQFPEEAKNYTDRAEGTAEFYTNHHLTRLYNLTHETSLNEFQHFKENLLDSYSPDSQFSLDAESYYIGAMAGMALSRLGIKNWGEQVQKGSSPLRLLGKQIKRKLKPINAKRVDDFLKLSIEKMKIIDPEGLMDNKIHLLANQKSVRVVIERKPEQQGSFVSSGFYRSFFEYQNLKNVTFINLIHPLTLSTPSGSLRIPAHDFWVRVNSTPCSDELSTLLLYDPKHTRIDGNTLIVKEKLKLTFHRKIQKSGTWICLLPNI